MPKNFAALVKEADTRLDSFDFGAAASIYREALKLRPGNAGPAMGLAMVYNRTGHPAQALKLLTPIWKAVSVVKGKELTVPKGAVLAQMGLALQQLGQFAEALKSYRQAHGLTPSAELTERIKTLQAAVERPEPIEQLLLHALQLRQSGRLDDAIKVFRAALQLNGDHPQALHGLGMALRDKKDLSGALPMLQKAIILAPGRADYYNDLGMLFQDQGELDKAVSFHNRALKIKPDFSAAYINLGVAHKRLGKFEDAIAAYRKAIALQPDSAEAHNNLGNLLRLHGDLAGARKELQKALALRPGYTDAAHNLAAVERQAREAARDSVKRKRAPARPGKKSRARPAAAAKSKPAARKPVAKKPAAKRQAARGRKKSGR